MSRKQCLKPIPHPRIIGMDMACRKCPACLKMMRVEWGNRMKLECFGKDYFPFFTTWTFSPQHYKNSEKACKADITRFWKRLRKAGHDIRYFTVIERGEHNNRLHGHTILWSRSLKQMPFHRATKILHDVWKNGIVDVQQVRSAKALSYVTKYIVKSLSQEKQRSYQWSQKPMLGNAGMEYWKKAMYDLYEDGRQWSIDDLPPNKMYVPILGKLDTVYIPRGQYVAFCKDMGVNFKPDDLIQHQFNDPLSAFQDNHESKPKIWQTEKSYREQKAKQ